MVHRKEKRYLPGASVGKTHLAIALAISTLARLPGHTTMDPDQNSKASQPQTL
jgi:DNA replication protein DnaC